MSMYISSDFTTAFKLQHLKVSYKVNKDKGVVTAIAQFYMPYDLNGNGKRYFQTIGFAYVGKKDTFDVEKGKKLARARADKEAFSVFKQRVDRFSKLLERLSNVASDTSKKMQKLIEDQKGYIKTF